MTDGLKPVGIELVAEGAPAFTNAVGKASTSLTAFERAGKAASAALGGLDQIVIGALRRIGELGINALVRAGRELIQFGVNTLQAAAQGSHLNTTLDTLGNRLLSIIRFNIDPLLNQFDSLVQKSTPAIEGWVSFLSQKFSELGQNALTWGENVSGQFAQGIYDGAQAVLDALIYIGNLITSWLMPGSPPKLLPDLDKWGTEAANVYLQGWTKADFSIFSTIGSEVESLLRSQAGKNDTGLIPRILGTREAIAAAVEQARQLGRVTAESLNNIYKAAGAVTPEIQGYLKSVFDLDYANTTLTAAQKELNDQTAKYAALLKPVDAQLSKISEAQKQFTEDQEKSRLALILKDPNATPDEKRQAQLRLEQIAAERNRRALVEEQAVVVDAAQAKVDAAQQAVTAAQAEYDSKKALIDLQIEQNQLAQEQAALLDRLIEKLDKVREKAGAGGGISPIKAAFELPQEIQDKIDALLAKLDTLRQMWATTWAAMVTTAKPFIDFVKLEFGLALPTIFTNLESSLAALAVIWSATDDIILFAIQLFWRTAVAVITGALTLLSGIVTTALQLLSGNWRGAWDTMLLTLRTFADQALAVVNMTWPQFQAVWSTLFENLSTILTTSLQTMSDNLVAWLNNTSANLIATWTGIFSNMASIAMFYLQPVLDAIAFITGNAGNSMGSISAPSAGPGGGGSTTTNSSVTNNFNLNTNTTQSSSGVALDFAAMGVWGAS